jgi:phage terminase Nu1 subunit (DNA packaging protein)
MAIVNVTRVAAFLNLTPQRVQQLVKEGMPREARGQYDPIRCGAWYVRFLQAAIEKKVGGGPMDGEILSEREQRLRLLRAQRELKEIELAKTQGLLVSIADVEKELTDLVLTTKARILAIPPRLAPELVGETSRVMIQGKIERACKEALSYQARRLEALERSHQAPAVSS